MKRINDEYLVDVSRINYHIIRFQTVHGTPVSPDSQTSWALKFCESTLATIALVNLLLIPLQFLPPTFFEQYGQYFGFLLLAIVMVAVLNSLIYAWVWHRREQSNRINSPLHHAWL